MNNELIKKEEFGLQLIPMQIELKKENEHLLPVLKGKEESLISVFTTEKSIRQISFERRDELITYMCGLIVEISEMVKGFYLSPKACVKLSESILKDFPNLKLTDIKEVCDNIWKGKYGKSYQNIDGQTIMSIFGEHVNEKMKKIEEIRIIENNTFKHISEASSINEKTDNENYASDEKISEFKALFLERRRKNKEEEEKIIAEKKLALENEKNNLQKNFMKKE